MAHNKHTAHVFSKLAAVETVTGLNGSQTTKWERYFKSVQKAKLYAEKWNEYNNLGYPQWTTHHDGKLIIGKWGASNLQYFITKLYMTKFHKALEELLHT